MMSQEQKIHEVAANLVAALNDAPALDFFIEEEDFHTNNSCKDYSSFTPALPTEDEMRDARIYASLLEGDEIRVRVKLYMDADEFDCWSLTAKDAACGFFRDEVVEILEEHSYLESFEPLDSERPEWAEVEDGEVFFNFVTRPRTL